MQQSMFMRWYKGGCFSLLAFLFMCLLMGCSATKEKNRTELMVLLAARNQAIARQDLPTFLQTIDPDYNDGQDTYHSLKAKYQHFFQHVKIIKYQILSTTLQVGSQKATLFQRYFLLYSQNQETTERQHDQVLRLKKTKQGWKIYEGLNLL